MDAIAKKYQSFGGAAKFGAAVGPRRSIGHKPAFQNKPNPPEIDETKLGAAQDYKNGTIYHQNEADNAWAVMGAIRAKYHGMGETAVLGFPTGDTHSPSDGGKYNTFQHGVIGQAPNASKAFAITGAIQSEWATVGGFGGPGYPTTEVLNVAGGTGQRQDFSNGSSVFFKSTIGAHEIHGPIRDFYLKEGGVSSNHGFPIARVQALSSGAHYSDFENGAIILGKGSTTAAAMTPWIEVDPQPGKPPAGSLSAQNVLTSVLQSIHTAIPKKVKVDGSSYDVTIADGPHIDSTHPITFFDTLPAFAPLSANGPVSDYRLWSGRLFNRGYKVRVKLEIEVPSAPNITIDLRLSISLALENNKLIAMPSTWTSDPSVPPIDTFLGGVWDVTVQNAVDDALEQLDSKPIEVASGLDPVLVVKTLTNGKLKIFLRPLF